MGPAGPTGAQGPPGPRSGGATYIRWGRTTCPDTEGTELVYKGRAAGSYWDHSGGGANYLCSVCYIAPRETVLMIPGKYTCPSGWTREYYGYLMSARYSHHRSTFECMDISPETIAGGHANQDGALFYHTEPRSGSLPCPPYEEQKEITCAVCSK